MKDLIKYWAGLCESESQNIDESNVKIGSFKPNGVEDVLKTLKDLSDNIDKDDELKNVYRKEFVIKIIGPKMKYAQDWTKKIEGDTLIIKAEEHPAYKDLLGHIDPDMFENINSLKILDFEGKEIQPLSMTVSYIEIMVTNTKEMKKCGYSISIEVPKIEPHKTYSLSDLVSYLRNNLHIKMFYADANSFRDKTAYDSLKKNNTEGRDFNLYSHIDLGYVYDNKTDSERIEWGKRKSQEILNDINELLKKVPIPELKGYEAELMNKNFKLTVKSDDGDDGNDWFGMNLLYNLKKTT